MYFSRYFFRSWRAIYGGAFLIVILALNLYLHYGSRPHSLNPVVEKYRQLGHIEEALHHYAEAETWYRKALEEKHWYVPSLRDLSRVLTREGHLEEAKAIADIATRQEQAPKQPR